MDKAYEMHLNVNRARIVGETLTYLNTRLGIMKDLTKDQAYYLTASAFRTYAFDEQDWNALKEKDEFFPKFLKDVKSLPYKSAIKKISDELWEKSNPNREKEEQEREEAERKAKEKEKKDKESIFEEEEPEQEAHNARTNTGNARDMNNVTMGDGKSISFHIAPDPEVEKRVLSLVHEGRFNEAHQDIRGFILECLEGQLSSEDLQKALNPGDAKISKPVQMNSVGITQTFHIKNQSLVDALADAHFGLVLTSQLLKEKKKEEDEMWRHKQHHYSHAIDELIIHEDVKAATAALDMDEDTCKKAVETELCDVCDHLEHEREVEALATLSDSLPKGMPPKENKATPKQAGPNPEPNPEPNSNELTDQDKKDIEDYGLIGIKTHSDMEEYRQSGAFERDKLLMESRSLSLPDDL